MNKKLEQIYESYLNGQKTQMVEQIKAYGQTKFVLDFYQQFHRTTSPKAEYAAVVFTFFSLK